MKNLDSSQLFEIAGALEVIGQVIQAGVNEKSRRSS
jgi:hypothetical protein